jgi:DNA polymerase III subunit beta
LSPMSVTSTPAPISFTVPATSLLEAAIKVGSIVPANGSRPIVSNVQFSAHDGILELAGTDLCAFLYHQIPDAKIISDGVGLMNSSRLLGILKEFKGTDISFEFKKGGNCTLKVKDDVLKIVGDDPRDYPALVRFDTEPGFQIKGADLVEMIHKTEFAANPEHARLAIHGVLFELKGDRFRLVATDTKRISYAQRVVQLPLNADGQPAITDFSAVAPLSSLLLLTRNIGKSGAEKLITIGVSGHYLFFRMPTATAYALMVNGKFPPYEDGYRAGLTKQIDCGVDAFIGLLKKIMLVDQSGAAFEFSSGKLTLKSQAPTIGEGDVSMPISYTGEKTRIGFSPKFIMEGLNAMVADRCRFSFDGPKKIGLLKELAVTDTGETLSDDYSYAVLPIVIVGDKKPSGD